MITLTYHQELSPNCTVSLHLYVRHKSKKLIWVAPDDSLFGASVLHCWVAWSLVHIPFLQTTVTLLRLIKRDWGMTRYLPRAVTVGPRSFFGVVYFDGSSSVHVIHVAHCQPLSMTDGIFAQSHGRDFYIRPFSQLDRTYGVGYRVLWKCIQNPRYKSEQGVILLKSGWNVSASS